MTPIFLASSSPRRRALLEQAGIPFTLLTPRVSEEVDGEPPPPHQLVERLARRKAAAGARLVDRGLIIGADTIVVFRGRVLGKPADSAAAEEMLHLLQGASHDVFTGLAVIEQPGGRTMTAWERTRVTFRTLTDEEIRLYAATGEPADKAGAYAAQGLGAIFITSIEGCYFNVVGLPLARLAVMLAGFGVHVLALAAGRPAFINKGRLEE
ncbi:Maf family protein [Desulfotomaculum copahuensis]|uniref:dTTP/UTP pyrophosphatase n=1 Tax=Desulfotomaculum copahuensis TaxID=1838280 RepID=A0A1B7LH88_9FIRM|nr:Maf family protein [Desulfotomaculum copahuensis]OAT85563.1 septum formation protein Maf [Desulfotomaculum copahuensis]